MTDSTPLPSNGDPGRPKGGPATAAVNSTSGSGRASAFDILVMGFNAFGTLWVLLLVLIINADALGRSFFSAPIPGVVEIVAISMALIVFCQLADTIRLGKLTRSDGFIETWLSSPGRLGRMAAAAFEALGAIFLVLVIFGTWPLLVKAYERGHYIGNEGIFTFPDWPIKACVVIGAALAAACFIFRAYRILTGRRPDPPDAVRTTSQAEGTGS